MNEQWPKHKQQLRFVSLPISYCTQSQQTSVFFWHAHLSVNKLKNYFSQEPLRFPLHASFLATYIGVFLSQRCWWQAKETEVVLPGIKVKNPTIHCRSTKGLWLLPCARKAEVQALWNVPWEIPVSTSVLFQYAITHALQDHNVPGQSTRKKKNSNILEGNTHAIITICCFGFCLWSFWFGFLLLFSLGFFVAVL